MRTIVSEYFNAMTVFCRSVVTCYFAVSFFVLIPSSNASETPSGDFHGAVEAPHPGWFKESFLDFREDIAEASVEGKRLLLYFWQRGCPYCCLLYTSDAADE